MECKVLLKRDIGCNFIFLYYLRKRTPVLAGLDLGNEYKKRVIWMEDVKVF